MKYVMLFESFAPHTESFMYREFECRIPFISNRNAYGAGVYEDDEYRYGLKGWTTKEKAIEWCKQVIDSHISRENKNKPSKKEPTIKNMV